jgi:hypothetical protein
MTRKGRKRLSVNFLARLKEKHPTLHERAVSMNKKDGFVMWNEREEYKSKFSGLHSESSSITSSSSEDSASSSSSSSGRSRSSSQNSHHRSQEKVD